MVGDDQVEAGPVAKEPQRLLARRRFDHGVPQIVEHVRNAQPNEILIVDQQRPAADQWLRGHVCGLGLLDRDRALRQPQLDVLVAVGHR